MLSEGLRPRVRLSEVLDCVCDCILKDTGVTSARNVPSGQSEITNLNTCSTSSLLSTAVLLRCGLDAPSPDLAVLFDVLDFFARFDGSLEALLISDGSGTCVGTGLYLAA